MHTCSPKECFLAVHTVQLAMISGRFFIGLTSRFIQLSLSSGPTHTLNILPSRITVIFLRRHLEKWPLLLCGCPYCTHSWWKISDWTFIMMREFTMVQRSFIVTRKLQGATLTITRLEYKARWLRNIWHVLNALPPSSWWSSSMCTGLFRTGRWGCPQGEMWPLTVVKEDALDEVCTLSWWTKVPSTGISCTGCGVRPPH